MQRTSTKPGIENVNAKYQQRTSHEECLYQYDKNAEPFDKERPKETTTEAWTIMVRGIFLKDRLSSTLKKRGKL